MTRQRRNDNRTTPTLMERIASSDPPPPWTVLSAVITLAAAFMLLVVGALMAEALIAPGVVPIFGWTFGGLLIALLVWQTRAKDRSALHLFPPAMPILLIIFIAFGAAVALDVVGLAITGQFVVVPELLLLPTDGLRADLLLVALLLLLVVQPVGEELLFRGVMQPALRATFGGWIGFLTSAVTYGLFHYLAYTPASALAGGLTTTYLWYGLIAPIIAGLFFGVVRINTASTRAAIAAHVAFGLFAVLKYLVILS